MVAVVLGGGFRDFEPFGCDQGKLVPVGRPLSEGCGGLFVAETADVKV